MDSDLALGGYLIAGGLAIIVLTVVVHIIITKVKSKDDALAQLCIDDSKFVAYENERRYRAQEEYFLDLKEWARDFPQYSKNWEYIEQNWEKVESFYAQHLKKAESLDDSVSQQPHILL